MKTVLITSKFDSDKHNYLSNVIDYSFIRFLEKLKHNVIILPNTKLHNSYYNKIKFDKIILSGGGDIFSQKVFEKKRLKIESQLIRLAIKKNIPLLGVCRGMQILCEFFGLNLVKIKNHVSKKHVINIKKRKIIRNSYHNYALQKKEVSKNFQIIGEVNDDSVELIKLKNKKIYGMMWHPERQSFKNFKHDLKLINFI